jgi:hypothetical protein
LAESTHIVDFDNEGKVDRVWLYDGTVATAGAYIWRSVGDGDFETASVRQVVRPYVIPTASHLWLSRETDRYSMAGTLGIRFF